MIENKYSGLFTPIEIGKVEIKNRIAMSPLGGSGLATYDGCFSQRAIDYYIERAKGGTGLIITGVTKIENEIEQFKPGILPNVSISPSRFILTASEMTERIHAYGAKIFLQLSIGHGRVASPDILLKKPVAPSVIPNYWKVEKTCRELSTEEVEMLVKRAGEAAEIAVQSGFDGIEIHAVHEGYLLDQFTIGMFNRRTDKYGGDLTGRLTFPIEIVDTIKKAAGSSFPVQLRFSIKSYIKDWNQGGLPDEDFKEKGRDIEEGIEVARILEHAGFDAFNVDGGSYEGWYWAHPPMYHKHGCYLTLSTELKKVVKVPVIVAGRMEIPDIACDAVLYSKADMVALGRGLLADPEWPNKVMEGKTETIRPCLACHDGCFGRINIGKHLSCAVNPACCREKEYDIKPAYISRNVMVVGGGLAGMEVARVTALRGHNVELYEKSKELGGHLIEASVPDFKEDKVRLLEWYKTELSSLNIKVYLNRQADSSLIEDLKPDIVIVATGSRAIVPDLPGMDREKVVVAGELLTGMKKAGDKVVVIGGGLVGCETALWLAMQGKKITIVELLNGLMENEQSMCHANKIMLKDLLDYHNVNIIRNTGLVEITNEGAAVMDKCLNEYVIDADTVVIAVGFVADNQLYYSLLGKTLNLYHIGDCREVRNIMGAIWDAYEIGREI